MIIGIGTDIIEISRIEKLTADEKRLFRIFTKNEIAYCSAKAHVAESYAGRFAAKEALLKAAGTGWRDGLKWTDFEIINDKLGKPEVKLHAKAQKIFEGCTIHISISHDKSRAVAFAVVEKKES